MSEDKQVYKYLLYIKPEEKESVRKLHSFNNIFEQMSFQYQDIQEILDILKELYFVRLYSKGEGLFVINNKEYPIESNSIIILNPNQDNYIEMKDPENTFCYSLGIKKVYIQNFIRTFIEKDANLLNNPELDKDNQYIFKIPHIHQNHQIENLIKKAIIGEPDLLANELSVDIYKQQLLYFLLNEELKHCNNNNNNNNKTIKSEISKRLQAVIDYLYDNYKEKITLNQLSNIAGLSNTHLIRIFNETMKCTPYQYLITIKMEKAKDLLKNKEISITEIALILGYSDVQSFTKAFKVHELISPSEYRNNLV